MNWNEAYNKYCHNTFRYLSFLNRFLHQKLNDRLEEAGFKHVKMQFIAIIPNLGTEGARLTDLAESHQIPKQTMAKLIKDAESQKLIARKPDPDDSRAKKIFISPRGIALVNAALTISHDIVVELLEEISEKTLKDLLRGLDKTFSALELSYPIVSEHPKIIDPMKYSHVQIQLTTIVEAIDLHLWRRNVETEFADLQNSYRAVLSHISETGVRVSDIANSEPLTKQSISDMVSKLIDTGYVEKRPNPEDERSNLLFFASRGRAMIEFAMENMRAVETRLESQVGAGTLDALSAAAWQLWNGLGGVGPSLVVDDEKSAQQLDELAQQMLRTLFDAIHSQDAAISSKVFHKSADGLMLTPEFVNRLRSATT